MGLPQRVFSVPHQPQVNRKYTPPPSGVFRTTPLLVLRT
jgi:hypothetical protein